MMKNFSEEEKKNLQIVSNKLGSIFELFKNENISTEDYHILLLLLSLYKDGFLSESILNESEDSIYKISNRIKPIKKSHLAQYENIFPIFIPVFKFLKAESLKKIIQLINEIDCQFLTKHFEAIFDKVLLNIKKSKISSVENYIQDQEITNLMLAFVNIEKGDKIFNPFAGLASFGLLDKKEFQYHGQEINSMAWAIGQLRLMAYGKFQDSQYICEDSITNWPDKSKKFNLIITSPDINLNLSNRYIKGEFISTYRTAEQFVIEKSLENLTEDGKLVICITINFLNRTYGEENIISNLLRKDFLEIVMPIKNNSYWIRAILVVNKNKEYPGKVRMYNTAKFVQKKNDWETEFNFNELIEFIKNNKQDDEILRFVDNDEIKKNDFILNVPRYFQKKIEGIRLGDVLEKVEGERINAPLTGKLIRTRDLKDKDIDFSMDLSKVEETELNRSDIQMISESCLLVASRWKSLKPTFFKYNGIPIFKTSDIWAFRIDESKVDIAYLINELGEDYVVDQIESVRMGAVVPFIRISDLLEVKIKLPSLKEQKAKAFGAFSAYQDAKLKESKLEYQINSIRENFNEELREKQHCIRQHLKNVVDSISVINSFMAKQNGTININDVINPIRNVTVGQRFEAMINSIRSLSLEIDNLTNDELYDKPELVGIRDILSECILEFGDTLGFSIHENFDEPILNEYGDNNPKISVSKRSFKELFNNIIMNASRHGFVENRQNLINITVTIKEGKLNVSFLNNGKPFARGIAKQLGVKGKKAGINAGSGIGVWKVFEIANHYGFEFQIMDLPEEEFPVGWEFKFNLTEMI
jgi:type I restriction enzyme M protein